MAPIDEKQMVERRMHHLLEDYGLPAPDEVEYGEACVRFLWHDRKVVVIVDIDTNEFGDHIPEGIAC